MGAPAAGAACCQPVSSSRFAALKGVESARPDLAAGRALCRERSRGLEEPGVAIDRPCSAALDSRASSIELPPALAPAASLPQGPRLAALEEGGEGGEAEQAALLAGRGAASGPA